MRFATPNLDAKYAVAPTVLAQACADAVRDARDPMVARLVGGLGRVREASANALIDTLVAPWSDRRRSLHAGGVPKTLIRADHTQCNGGQMTDDSTKTGAADRLRINVNQPHELAYWTKTLGVSEDELRSAVGKVGVMANDVKRHFGK